MMRMNADPDTCMDILPDVPAVDAGVAIATQPRSRGLGLPSQDPETSESVMEFFRLLGRPGSRRHHRHCPARRPDNSALLLDSQNSDNLTDGGQPQATPRGRQSLVWFIPNEPRVRLPQDGLTRRDSGPGESLRICKRHGHMVGKHGHIPRSHQIHVHRPRGRSCPPDPVGQGHGSGRPPQRPTRIWIPSKRLYRSQRLWFPGRLGMAPPADVTNPAGDDQIAAALEENARALQSLRIQPDAPEAPTTSAVASPPPT
eukprot:TRINITY_DN3993_c0_g1_i1.p1 TRINITY_DN3993_c0_g1~~TRINITY_DN3993_c0_g1_i1.p1  ORF type:complete len:257 (-),score=15.26 TRINITY_DN3993_c0_g1_i1:457-1227(-)